MTEPTPTQERTLLLRLAHWQLRRRAAAAGRRRWGRWTALLGVVATAVAGGVAWAYFTANGTGTGQASAATVSNLTISAVATPSPTHQLYPGAAGDVVAAIANPNAFPVTITAVSLPSASSYAAGYTTSGLTTPVAGCSASGPTASTVAWSYAAGTNPHTLATPLTVGAGSSLTVTFTGDASMGLTAPAACEGAYLTMPSLTGITATSSTAASTTSPATDSWTS